MAKDLDDLRREGEDAEDREDRCVGDEVDNQDHVRERTLAKKGVPSPRRRNDPPPRPDAPPGASSSPRKCTSWAKCAA